MEPTLSHARLRPFGWTYVVYADGDRVGHILALFSMAPVFIIVALVTTLAQRRDLATLAMLSGQLLNELLNLLLKSLIREERPNTLHQYAPRFGMPSNHAQFMGFTAAYVTLWALKHWQVSSQWRLCAVGSSVTLAAIVIASRVYLNYHSVAQVIVGGAVGAAAAALWFSAVEVWLRPRFAVMANSAIGRYFLLRDCTGVNVVEAEYAAVAGSVKGVKRPAGGAALLTPSSATSADPAPLFSPQPAAASDADVRVSGLHRRSETRSGR